MELDHRIREAETRLFARSGLQPEESFFDLPRQHVRPSPRTLAARVRTNGSGTACPCRPSVSHRRWSGW